jgi:hypothetical protein
MIGPGRSLRPQPGRQSPRVFVPTRQPPSPGDRWMPKPVKLPSSVTVCLAAACPMIGRIVTVSDTRLSFVDQKAGSSSSIKSTSIKFRFLTEDCRWACLFAGSAATFLSLHARIYERLRASVGPVGVVEAKASIEAAYRDEMAHRRTKRINVQLLICGFDLNNAPQVLTSWNDGIVDNHSVTGFAVVGCGYTLATNWLSEIRDFRDSRDVGEVLYRLCEAKFTAELDRAVGPETFALSFDPNGTSTQLFDDDLRCAYGLWKKRRNARPSARVLAKLRGGAKFDKHGNSPFTVACIAYSDALRREGELHLALASLHAQKIIPDDTYVIIDATHVKTLEYMNTLSSVIASWNVSSSEPADVDVIVFRLNEALDRLQKALDSYTTKP